MSRITIYQGGTYAGEGTLERGRIEDCPACLGPSRGQDKTDDVEGAYVAIEAALEVGMPCATWEGVLYTWDIEEED